MRKDKLCTLGKILGNLEKKEWMKEMHMFKKISLYDMIDDDALSMLLEFFI